MGKNGCGARVRLAPNCAFLTGGRGTLFERSKNSRSLARMSKSQTDATLVADHWAGDLLGRKHDSRFLKQFLLARIGEREARGTNGSYVLNLDAGWGQGKTFFLHRFFKDLAANHTVAYVNAWEDDYADDPLVAIMTAVSESLPKSKTKVAGRTVATTAKEVAVLAAKHVVLTAGRRVLGEGVDALRDVLGQAGEGAGEATGKTFEDVVARRADAALAKYTEAKKSVAEFKKGLSDLLARGDVQTPLFILVDELDRCRPTYAISLLERVKHLFDVDNVVFVIATDASQLRHSITAVYGQGFDGAGYLLRFFDRTYRFAEPNVVDFVRALFAEFQIDNQMLSAPDRKDPVSFFATVAESYSLSPREIKRSFDIMRSSITIWPYPVKIELLLLLPIVVAQCRGDVSALTSLSKLSSTNMPNRASEIVLEFASYRDRDGRADKVSLSQLFETFLELARTPLSDIHDREHSRGYRSWLAERFVEEFGAMHGFRRTSPNAPRSVCRDYVELVRSVGRLSPEPNAGSA
jgi:hypothetical protein